MNIYNCQLTLPDFNYYLSNKTVILLNSFRIRFEILKLGATTLCTKKSEQLPYFDIEFFSYKI